MIDRAEHLLAGGNVGGRWNLVRDGEHWGPAAEYIEAHLQAWTDALLSQ